jgi:NADPH-dependent 2,4-dienoyl-CoA reductase/sulfur reductase-like enzyme
MIEAAAQHRHAVVIGGGLLGLEAANGLRQRGMQVTVVHVHDWLMERQLDAQAAACCSTAWNSAACSSSWGPDRGAAGRRGGPRCARCACATAASCPPTWW